VLRPERCYHCGSSDLEAEPMSLTFSKVTGKATYRSEWSTSVRPCRCCCCGQETQAAWPNSCDTRSRFRCPAYKLSWAGWKYAHLSLKSRQSWCGNSVKEIGIARYHQFSCSPNLDKSSVRPLEWVRKQTHVHVDETLGSSKASKVVMGGGQ